MQAINTMSPPRKKTAYDLQAEKFLADNGITFSHSPAYAGPSFLEGKLSYHYTIMLAKPGKSVSFPFTGSVADYEKGIRALRPYDVLACISSDASFDGTFEDFCSEFGYDMDSRKALETYLKVQDLSSKLRRFFTREEIGQLSEIQ